MDARNSSESERDNEESISLGVSMPTNVPSNAQTVYVTIPQNSNSKGVHSVIQQPQQSVIQSTAVQAVQLSKGPGGVLLLKHPSNSVIQSPSHNLQTVQVLHAENIDEQIEPSRKRQILARRPSYKKILNDLSASEIIDKGDVVSSDSSQDDPSVTGTTTTITLGGQQYQTAVIPASSLQLASGPGGEGLQTITMTNATTAAGTIVHYSPGNSEGQFIVPVAASDLAGLKIASSSGGVGQGVVLTSASAVNQIQSGNDTMVEEASRKREIRLMKNREAARECRAKKKEYIKCLENRVAVLENQNRTLIEELKTIKSLYGLNDVKE